MPLFGKKEGGQESTGNLYDGKSQIYWRNIIQESKYSLLPNKRDCRLTMAHRSRVSGMLTWLEITRSSAHSRNTAMS